MVNLYGIHHCEIHDMRKTEAISIIGEGDARLTEFFENIAPLELTYIFRLCYNAHGYLDYYRESPIK